MRTHLETIEDINRVLHPVHGSTNERLKQKHWDALTSIQHKAILAWIEELRETYPIGIYPMGKRERLAEAERVAAELE